MFVTPGSRAARKRSAGLTFPISGDGKSVAVSTPLLNLTQTWNGSDVFTALKLNVTRTSAIAGSPLLDLQCNGLSYFSFVPFGGPGTTDIVFTMGSFSGTGSFINYINSANAELAIGISNIIHYYHLGPNLGMVAGCSLQWTSSTTDANQSTKDTFISRDEAGILSVPKTIRLYNQKTDLSNYERGVLDWTTTSNVFIIGTQAAGTGTLRPVNLISANALNVYIGSGVEIRVGNDGATTSSGIQLRNTHSYGWDSSGAPSGASNTDTALQRIAAGVVGIGTTNEVTVAGWIQWVGQKRVTGDFSKTTDVTLADVTGLSVSLQAGRTYSFTAEILFTCAAAGGVQAAIAGTATATNIIYNGYIVDSGANGIKGNTQATALATAVASATTTGTTGIIRIMGTITVNAAGTLTVQFAQNTSNGTASVAKRGSFFMVYDMP